MFISVQWQDRSLLQFPVYFTVGDGAGKSFNHLLELINEQFSEAPANKFCFPITETLSLTLVGASASTSDNSSSSASDNVKIVKSVIVIDCDCDCDCD